MITAIILVSCKTQQLCFNPEVGISCPYDVPIWHPSGRIIGFNHLPLNEIRYSKPEGECPSFPGYYYENDSIGFWLINADGTNMRRILPYKLNTPAWSPDGKWIAFTNSGQLCVMPFDGEKFDITAVQTLPIHGVNYCSAWSSDGKKIAYTQSVCNDSLVCGVWIYDFEKKYSESVGIYGGFASWSPNSNSLIYLKGDSVFSYNNATKTTNFIKYLNTPSVNNRYVKYSPDGKMIAFLSILTGKGEQLFRINSDGTELTKLTTEGCVEFSWSPENKIVFVSFDGVSLDKTKGTLWIMNADGSNKRVLTYNIFETHQ